VVGCCGYGNEPTGSLKVREFRGMTVSFLRTSVLYAHLFVFTLYQFTNVHAKPEKLKPSSDTVGI
jgi:hypothetical protein